MGELHFIIFIWLPPPPPPTHYCSPTTFPLPLPTHTACIQKVKWIRGNRDSGLKESYTVHNTHTHSFCFHHKCRPFTLICRHLPCRILRSLLSPLDFPFTAFSTFSSNAYIPSVYYNPSVYSSSLLYGKEKGHRYIRSNVFNKGIIYNFYNIDGEV